MFMDCYSFWLDHEVMISGWCPVWHRLREVSMRVICMMQLVVLWFIRKKQPRVGRFLELTSLAIPISTALAKWKVCRQLCQG